MHLNPDRLYDSYAKMAAREPSLPEGERIDSVSLVTPNNSHFEIARTFIEVGFHVVCDKPLTTTLADAEELCRLVERHDVVFVVTHNYTGYPMVNQARELVRQGHLGEIRKIVAEYPQGWLANIGGMNMWRLDPKVAGISSAVGDIGIHAWHRARYISGLEVESLSADLTSFGSGYELEDDTNLLVHYQGGARGISTRRGSPWGKRTTCACASTGPRRGWISGRKIRITCACSTWTSPSRSTSGQRLRRGDRAAQHPHPARAPRSVHRSVRQRVPERALVPKSLPSHYSDGFAYLAAVVRGTEQVRDTDLSSLSNNVTVVRILDAAIRSARMSQTVALGGEPRSR